MYIHTLLLELQTKTAKQLTDQLFLILWLSIKYLIFGYFKHAHFMFQNGRRQ